MRLLLPSCFMLLAAVQLSCSVKKNETQVPATDSVAFTISAAPEWTALFDRTDGWFGGDGIFAIPFSGSDVASDSVMFLFSDTMVGQITNGKLQPGYTMINNSVMILQGREPAEANAKFLVNPKGGTKPVTLFTPSSPQAKKDDYFWLGDGFVNASADSSLCIFAYRIRNTNDGSAFPFREVGNNLIVIPKGSAYPFSAQRQLDLPFSGHADSLTTSYGVGVLQNTTVAGAPDADGYLYVYGVRGRAKELVAARVKPETLQDFSKWEFYNGQVWTNSPATAVPIADSVSNELSVTPLGNNQYALIYQYAGLMPTIYMQIGSSPVGPFGPRLKVWNTADEIKEKGLFAYNAKAHPAISKPGELLVSYNVNSFEFFKQIEDIPNLYRPRFVRIVFTK